MARQRLAIDDAPARCDPERGDPAPIAGLTLEDYRRDRFRLRGTERLLQETIEAAVDAGIAAGPR